MMAATPGITLLDCYTVRVGTFPMDVCDLYNIYVMHSQSRVINIYVNRFGCVAGV